MQTHPPLSGRSSEAEFLGRVGYWYVDSNEAKAHTLRIRKFAKKGLIGLRRHRRTDGEIVEAYELTDSGLARLEEVAGAEIVASARELREYLRKQARKSRVS